MQTHCWCEPHGGLSLNTTRAGGGEVGPRSRNRRTSAWCSRNLAPLLFETKLPFNLFLSFISQANQHGAM